MTGIHQIFLNRFFCVYSVFVINMVGCATSSPAFLTPHLGGGPVIGAVLSRGFTVGWEAGGGTGPLLRANLGGSYRFAMSPKHFGLSGSENDSNRRQSRSNSEYIHYLVYEPGIILGGTVGVAYSDLIGIDGSFGVWTGIPLPLTNTETNIDDENPFTHKRGKWRPFIGLTIGWRYLAGESEIYFAPKVFYDFVPHISLGS